MKYIKLFEYHNPYYKEITEFEYDEITGTIESIDVDNGGELTPDIVEHRHEEFNN